MKIDVSYVLNLARIRLNEEEREKIRKDLEKIVEYFENLNELNTEDVEPTFHAIKRKNVFREDEVREFEDKEKILENAPEKEGNYFKVKRVIEEI